MNNEGERHWHFLLLANLSWEILFDLSLTFH